MIEIEITYPTLRALIKSIFVLARKSLVMLVEKLTFQLLFNDQVNINLEIKIAENNEESIPIINVVAKP